MFRSQSNPRRGISPIGDSHLPKGECRYILLHPEVQGQRCACVGFRLNNATPGSTCDCGHQSCYHLVQQEERVLVENGEELESLKEKIRLLEEDLDREKQSRSLNILDRLKDFEETTNRQLADMEMELKRAYQDIGGVWQNVGIADVRAKRAEINVQHLKNLIKQYEDQLEALADTHQATKDDCAILKTRVIELDDASMRLEDRVERLETAPGTVIPLRSKASTPDDSKELIENEEVVNSTSKPWTVHVSLLPTSSRLFPFEKDTIAYQRCLSRGLHRLCGIPGEDAGSFNRAISQIFYSHLLGRPWMPLIANMENAKALYSLPSLSVLEYDKRNSSLYDYDWLKDNCAVVTSEGKIQDLYISMIDHELTWSEVRRAPIHVKELEACWKHDKVLDGPFRQPGDNSAIDEASEDETPAGALITSWSSTSRMKRPGSALSRESSFGSSEGELAKRIRLQHTEPTLESLRKIADPV